MTAAHAPRLVDWSEGVVCTCGKERCGDLLKRCDICHERPGTIPGLVDGDALPVEVCAECWDTIE